MPRRKGDSIFSYPLTRPYPFTWFTYVTLIGGVICVVLFSFVAIATDGYNLEPEYVLDLNGTLEAYHWSQRAPFSWISQTAVSHQPASLTTGNTYFTSNLGFIYSLDRLWLENSHRVQNDILPAAAYSNTTLQDCSVRQIEIDFSRRDQATGVDPWSWGLTSASATVACSFQSSSFGEVVQANFTTKLPEVWKARSDDGLRSFGLSVSIYQHANLWFGAQLTNAWYKQLSPAMGYAPALYGDQPWSSGTVVLSRNQDVGDYTDPHFFFARVNFLTNSGTLASIKPPQTVGNWADPSLNAIYGLPNITTTLDTFAKSFYSVLLSDFGVIDKTNALLTPAGVKWLQNQVDYELAINSYGYIGNGNFSGIPSDVQNATAKDGSPYPINQAYQLVVDAMGPRNLNSTPNSTIYTQYLCSIPKLKGPGALFFSVLLADLVFLQTCWTVLNLAATWWLERSYDHANYCDGCHIRNDSVTRKEVGPNGVEHMYHLLDGGSVRSSSIMLQQVPESDQSADFGTIVSPVNRHTRPRRDGFD